MGSSRERVEGSREGRRPERRLIGAATVLAAAATVVEAFLAIVIGKLTIIPGRVVWLFPPLVVVLALLNAAQHREAGRPTPPGPGRPRRLSTAALTGVLLVLLVGQVVIGVLVIISNRNPYGSCSFDADAVRMALPYPSVSNEQQLRFCPVRVNDGRPLTGPFALEGDVLGPLQDRQQIALVSLAHSDTCDTLGNHGTGGYFYFPSSGFAKGKGHWRVQENLGYPESITITRSYIFVQGSPAALALLATDRDKWIAAGKDPLKYPGMRALPPDSRPVAKFDVSGGTYQGQTGRCGTG